MTRITIESNGSELVLTQIIKQITSREGCTTCNIAADTLFKFEVAGYKLLCMDCLIKRHPKTVLVMKYEGLL